MFLTSDRDAGRRERHAQYSLFDGVADAQRQFVKRRAEKFSVPNTNLPQHLIQSGTSPGSFWTVRRSVLERAASSQLDFAEFIATKIPPEAVGTLYTPKRLPVDAFKEQVRAWRKLSAWLHPAGTCPQRSRRKIEYILALEYGPYPRRSNFGRLHGHVLLWNLRQVSLERLGFEWRKLNGIHEADIGEPHLAAYDPTRHYVGYCLKTFHTDADFVDFSGKFGKLRSMLAMSPRVASLQRRAEALTDVDR